MMDSPAQRALRQATEMVNLLLILAVYLAFVDGSLLVFIWNVVVVFMVQRAVLSLRKKVAKDDRSRQNQQAVESMGSDVGEWHHDIEDFYGSQYLSPFEHRRPALRLMRALAFVSLPFVMHLYLILSFPFQNSGHLAGAEAAGVITEDQYRLTRSRVLEAGDSPASWLGWQRATASMKFWVFVAAPEISTPMALLVVDAAWVATIYTVITLLVAASGGPVADDKFIQLLPLHRNSCDSNSHTGSPSVSPTHTSSTQDV